jgi:hypothetical protein
MKIVSPLKQFNSQKYHDARSLFLVHNKVQKEIRNICIHLISDAPLLSSPDITQTDDLCFLEERQRARIFSDLHEIKKKFHELKYVWTALEKLQ